VKGKAVSAEAKRAQAVASIRREEAVLAQQANDLSGQVRWVSGQFLVNIWFGMGVKGGGAAK
jgi:hypothetical protein